MELKAGFVCDRGLNPRRPVNQDRFLALPERGLFAVFDGVGGQQAGEVASQTAADTIEEALTIAEALAHIKDGSSAELIRRAIGFANRDIIEMAESNPLYKTMATTVALVHINGDLATIAHVGDSRVYQIRDGKVQRRTRDHSHVELLLREGLIRETDVKAHPMRNFVECCLGGDHALPDMSISGRIALEPGDLLLACSDGYWSGLDEKDLAKLGSSRRPLDQQLLRTSELAIKNNGPNSDNTSALALVWYPIDAAARERVNSGPLANAN